MKASALSYRGSISERRCGAVTFCTQVFVPSISAHINANAVFETSRDSLFYFICSRPYTVITQWLLRYIICMWHNAVTWKMDILAQTEPHFYVSRLCLQRVFELNGHLGWGYPRIERWVEFGLNRSSWGLTGGDCLTWNCVICGNHQVYSGDWSKRKGMREFCSAGGGKEGSNRVLIGKPGLKRRRRRSRHWWEGNIKLDLHEI
jgi:hypothetical protein